MKAQSTNKVKEKVWSEEKLQKYKKYWKILKQIIYILKKIAINKW